MLFHCPDTVVPAQGGARSHAEGPDQYAQAGSAQHELPGQGTPAARNDVLHIQILAPSKCLTELLPRREVHAATQKGLTSMLKQAALNMSPQDRARLQLGPPPLVGFSGIVPLPPALIPHPPLMLAPTQLSAPCSTCVSCCYMHASAVVGQAVSCSWGLPRSSASPASCRCHLL